MPDGYMGKILFIDLSSGKLEEKILPDDLYGDLVGGYGLAARFIYNRQKGQVDPLGEHNILGFATGPLTGVRGFYGSRYTVVGKSPLTGGWGDANSGGAFGPNMKFSGYDAIFLTGISENPVYLYIDNGKAELRAADHLWGKDTHQSEDIIRAELGKKVSVCAIGPSGEKLSLISCVINDKGRAAARSGLGAVMGSKKLKAIAVTGTQEISLPDKEKAAAIAKEYRAKLSGMVYEVFPKYGTSAGLQVCVLIGDSPVKNWAGVGEIDFPNGAAISDDKVLELVEKQYGCWGCPVGCGALMKAGAQYNYEAGVHRPEYETLAAIGPMCLNDNLESIIKATDICNRYGLDTISLGGTIAFAIECYENGLVTTNDTGGIELNWGNHQSIVKIARMIANREGFGDVLADGVRRAALQIGKDAEPFAIHAGGQEIPMHDPRLAPSFAGSYQADPTPGRHTQGGLGSVEMGIAPPEWLPALDKYSYTGKGKYEAMLKNVTHVVNASGICSFLMMMLPDEILSVFLTTVTGREYDDREIQRAGERIANVRQAFNCREGIKPNDFNISGRPAGKPPLEAGPTANVTVDADTLRDEYFKAMDWDIETGRPSRQKLLELGLDDIAGDLWP